MKRYNDCMEVREDFSAYLDGELDLEEREPLEAHLAICADCLREMDVLKRVDDSFRRLAPAGAPADFEAGVREAVRIGRMPVSGGRRPVPRWMGPLVAMASAASVLIVGVLVLERQQRDRSGMQMASAPAVVESEQDNDALMKSTVAEAGTPEGDSPAARGAGAAWDRFARTPARDDKAWERMAQPAPGGAGAVVGGREDSGESLGQGLAAPERVALGAASAVPGESADAENRARSEVIGTPPPLEEKDAEPQKVFDALKNEQVDTLKDPAAPPPGAPAQAGEVVSRRTLRAFHVLAGGLWVEEGYDHEPTTPLKRGSREMRELMKKYPEAEWSQLLDRSARQVFQVGDTWYDLEAKAEDEP